MSSANKAITYQSYVALIKDLVGKKLTTGQEQTEERINFTKLNASRMRRLDKTIHLSEKDKQTFKNVKKQFWLIISEAWCGDAAQSLPILNKIAEASPSIELGVVLRDENLELMNLFLTNGAQAIPKLIILDENHEVLATWGARSKKATALVTSYKAEHGKIDANFKEQLQVWYNNDKGASIISDMTKIQKTIN